MTEETDFASEQGAFFDTMREAYEAAQKKLLDLIDGPDKGLHFSEYRKQLNAALQEQQEAHDAMMAAWEAPVAPLATTPATIQPSRSVVDVLAEQLCGWNEDAPCADCLDDAERYLAALAAAGFGSIVDAVAEVAEDALEGLRAGAPGEVLAIGFMEGYSEAARDLAERGKA